MDIKIKEKNLINLELKKILWGDSDNSIINNIGFRSS